MCKETILPENQKEIESTLPEDQKEIELENKCESVHCKLNGCMGDNICPEK